MSDYADLIEKLAAIEHEQWVQWSKNIARTERLSPGRVIRWESLWVPYDELEDAMKDHDRKWARIVIAAVQFLDDDEER